MSAIEHLPLSSLQPQGLFRLRRDSPLFEGLTLVALPNHGPRNLVSGYFGGYNGAPTLVAGPGGIELNSSMAGTNRLLLSPEFTTSSTPQSAIYDVSVLSALVITYQTAAQNVDYALGRMNGSGNPGWAVGLHSGSSNGPAARLGSYSVAGTTGGNRRSDPTVVLLTGDGTTATVYENGAVYASDSYTAPSYEYSSFGGRAVLMGGAGVSAASQCRTSLGLFWSGRVIPPAVAALIASPADVWRLLVEPQSIWVPVGVGGSSWSANLTESASGTDTSTASFVINASVSITESASGIDTPAAANVMARSITENASGADTITAANTMARSITENASATDDQSETYSATGNASIVESASATDTLTAAATVVASLVESASAADILTAATIAVHAITESASATDTQSHTYSAAGAVSIIESANATDTITAAATLLRAIVEAGNATDAVDAATTMVRTITEQATAIDTVAGALPGSTWYVSIDELAAAVDLIAGYAAGGLTVSPLGLRLSAGGRSARLSTTARMPRLSTRTR